MVGRESGIMKAGKRSTRNETLKLDCPLCAAIVEVPRAQLVDGCSVQCPHCLGEATLTKERIQQGDQAQWTLIEVAFDDERR
jgi:uncharacterized paraquat-inducible protein A